MRRLVYILLAMVSVLAACRRVADDAALVRADALMAAVPDSALRLLDSVAEATDSGAHLDAANRAYYGLLRTQVLYKCYIPATSDSLITHAREYYSRHPQGDRLLRSVIYSGTTADELGRPTEAMEHYRHAESLTDTADHATLGYINLRIATLYTDSYTAARDAIPRARRAVWHYRHTGDSFHLLASMALLVSSYGLQHSDSALIILSEARHIADSVGDEYYQSACVSDLARHYLLVEDDYVKAKEVAMSLLCTAHAEVDESIVAECCDWAAQAYAQLGQVDSAKWCLLHRPAPQSASDSMTCYETDAMIALHQGDYARAYEQQRLAVKISDSLLIHSHKARLIDAERRYELAMKDLERMTQESRNNNFVVVILLMLLLCGSVLGMLRIQKQRNALLEVKLEQMGEDLETARALMQGTAASQNAPVITTAISKHLEILSGVYDNLMVDGRKRGIAGVLKSVQNLKLTFFSQDFWHQLEQGSDERYEGLITCLRTTYNEMFTEQELRVIMLASYNIPNIVIKLCFNLSNEHSVANLKYTIKSKLPLLQDEAIAARIKSILEGHTAP